MERYSAWRDSSTGIIPFVVPVHPASDASNVGLYLLWPIRMLVASLRMALFVVLLAIMWLLQTLISILFIPFRSLSNTIQDAIAAFCLRTIMALCFGFYWVSEESVSSLRRSNASTRASTLSLYRENPNAGDVIIANWSSSIDVLWLAFRYQPIFVLPIVASVEGASVNGRKRITGFTRVSLMQMLNATGRIPTQYSGSTGHGQPLEAILKAADRPVVLLPEATTSNNRGLLRFCALPALRDVPTTSRAFLVGIRYDAPSLLLPTATNPIPNETCNPLGHLFQTATTPFLPPRHLIVKVLIPLDKSGQAAELPTLSSEEFWSRAANLLGSIGKLKQMNIGWEEKEGFLEYYSRKPGSLKPSTSGTATPRGATPTKGRAAAAAAAKRRQL